MKAACKEKKVRYRSARSKFPPGVFFVLRNWEPSAAERRRFYDVTGYHHCPEQPEGLRVVWPQGEWNYCPYCSDELPYRPDANADLDELLAQVE